FGQLTGSPDAGGTWSPAMNSGTGVFDPNIDAGGTYTYTVTNSCGSDNSDVVVTVTSNPDPGTNGVAQLCANAATINLFDSLNGTPTSGGAWSPALNSGTGVFDPAIDAAGTYTYALNACGGGTLTAEVQVTINPAPNAGIDGVITLCTTDAATNLFGQLTGSPNAGGTWSPAMNSGTGVFDPSIDAGGTYTYTVTNSCGSDNSNVVVSVNPCTVPTALFSASDDTICAGECVTFTDQSTGATSWQWTFNGGTPSSSNQQNPGDVCFAIDGTYTIELVATNTFGSDTYTSTLTVHPTPIVDAGSDVIIKLNESTQLNASGSTGNFVWTPPTGLDCTNCPNPISSPEETITYTVIVSDPNGCTATDDITVFVEYENVIFVPNIFSPNGDGQNDILFVRGKGVQELKFFIYDRWGEKVFETTDLDIGWDGTFRGKEMNKAVFVYYLEATFIDGEEVKQKGDITLVK
ncbi:MAG: gliding motility-associated C-terminal domain-containing protein, partial [Flavobacteriales bacterium]|nr:gliding motility-associated C-terminal domain-containing protein [Flavobacteriales bacterium]